METRANYAIVGLFTLAVLAGAFGFVYWFAGRDKVGQRLQYDIVFDGSVSGLSRGSSVLFNGIRKGEVVEIRQHPTDFQRVIATVAVEHDTPVRADTEAKLEFQGLTGIASVALAGGRADAAELASEPGRLPRIEAKRSDFQDILSTVQRLAMRADELMVRANKLIADNEGSVGRALRNVETFTDALAQNSDGVNRFLSATASAADRIASLSVSIEEIVKGIEPGKVGKIVSDIEVVAGTLATNRGEIETTLKEAAALGRRLNEVGARLDSLVADAAAVMRRIEPDKVGRTIENADKFVATLGDNAERIDRVLKDAASIAGRLDGVMATLETNRPEISAMLKDAASLAKRLNELAPKLDTAIADVGALARAFDPAKVGRVVDNVDRFAAALGGNTARFDQVMKDAASISQRFDGVMATLETSRPEITAMLKDAASLAKRLNDSAPKLDTALADVSALAKAFDPAKVGRVVDNVDRFAEALGGNTTRFDQVMKDVASISQRFDGLMGTLETSRPEISAMLKDAASLAKRLNESAPKLDAALADVSALAKAFDPAKVGRVVDNVDRFAQALGDNRAEIDKALKEAASITGKLDVAAGKLDSVLTAAQKLLGSAAEGDAKGLFAEITETARAIRTLAANLDGRTADITTGINRFTGPVAREYQALANDGRRTLGDIQRVLRSFERNPQQLILGGRPPIPEFQGRR